MKNKMMWKFAKKNIKANQMFQIPFILSMGIMTSVLYIMLSIAMNPYVAKIHPALSMLMGFGVVVLAILLMIFSLYTNQFLMKRRNKEFALYAILGLEKKHVSRILLFEQLINTVLISIIAVFGGYFIGKVIFLSFYYLLKDKGITFMNYPFSSKIAVIVIIVTIGMMGFTFLINRINIQLNNPMMLFQKQKAGEKEPKSKHILLLIGLITLGSGYYIALTSRGMLDALFTFFIAALLVICGTYFLFTSLSIFVLQKLRHHKAYYYQKEHFISVSGMIYRMKANALGLASICVLCTGIIIALGTTIVLFYNSQNLIDSIYPNEYTFESKKSYTQNFIETNGKDEENKWTSLIKSSVKDPSQIPMIPGGYYLSMITDIKGNHVNSTANKSLDIKNAMNYLTTYDLETFKKRDSIPLDLKSNEVYMTSNNVELKKLKEIWIAGKKYKVKPIDIKIPMNIVMDHMIVIMPKMEDLYRVANFYKVKDFRTQKLVQPTFSLKYTWDVENEPTTYLQDLNKKIKDRGYTDIKISSRADFTREVYSLTGSFILLGFMIGSIFLIATVLILYYKQLSEGFNDRENIQIMKKIGLSDDLIKRTTKNQLVWIFFIPLIVAAIHTIVASPVLYRLTKLFGGNSIPIFIKTFVMIIGIFSVIYYVIYKFTSFKYYKIVR